MSHHRQRLLGGLAVLLGLLALPGAARAQETYTYSVGVLGGLGGSFDASPGNSYNNASYQLNLSMLTEPKTLVGIRIGRLNLDKQDFFGTLSNANLSYVTVGGEYRFRETYYDSGLYLGLGAYRLRGNQAASGRSDEQTSVGLSFGVTGEIPINKWFGVLLELSGHYVDLQQAKIYGMGHGGITVHF